MSKPRVYLDYNASAPMRAEAARAISRLLGTPGNASSVHSEGRAARACIEDARRAIAALTGAGAHSITFTSGGTEAANLALTPHLHRANAPRPRLKLFVSAIEHPCVLQGHRFAVDRVETIPVKASGVVDLDALKAGLERLEEGEAPLVSVMLANNETGVIQPVREAAALAHEHGGFLHTDAVQAAGKIPISIDDLDADMMSVSAHKIGGPQGCGALIAREDMIVGAPLIRGGGQEKYLRGGTENLLGIAGFGAAASAAYDIGWSGRCGALRDRLEAGLAAVSPKLHVFGAGEARLPNTSCFALEGVSAETALIAFDLAGMAVSSGSACSSGKVSASHVLKAMDVPAALGTGAIRISLGWDSAEDDVERVLQAWRDICARAGVAARAA